MWFRLQKARIRLLLAKTGKEAKKLALIIVCTQFVLVGAYYYVCQSDTILNLFRPEVIIINQVQAKETKPDNVSELANYIHFRESTNGTAEKGLHITCRDKGLSNEYGYNPPMCYKDNASVRKLVESWIIDHKAQGLTDEELLRHYSNGAYGVML